jgi:DNA-binding winged helix-turn-helix (wHTH) protein
VYLFPPFRLDPSGGRLWRGTEVLHLRPKTLEVLRVLVGHRGQVVSRAELLQTVWPRRHGGQNAPKQCISELRRALGEGDPGPRYIETVGRQGYRFVGLLEPADGGPEPAGTAAPRAAPALPDSPGPACVGRAAEGARLVDALGLAAEGRRPMVLVTGEAGSGKTTLVDAFCAGPVARRGMWAARAHCVPHQGPGEPYHPLLEALERLGRGPVRARLLAAFRAVAPDWLARLPGLRAAARRPGAGRAALGANRAVSARELTEALERLASESPGVLVLEDLQWSDEATLDWLAGWARRRSSARLLLVGTFRPEAASGGLQPLRGVVQELRQQRLCQVLALGGLSEEAVTRYLSARLGDHAFPPALGTLLSRRSEGHAASVVSLVDDWLARGWLRRARGHWTLQVEPGELEATVPGPLRDLVEHRLEALTGPERQVLEAASTAGFEFCAAAVAAGLRVEVEEVETVCSSLARRELFIEARGAEVWPAGTVSARYAFRHALCREAVAARLPAGQRQRLQQRIAAGSTGAAARAPAEPTGELGREGTSPGSEARPEDADCYPETE